MWLEDKEEEEVILFIVNPEKYLEVLMVEMEVMGVMSFWKVKLTKSVLFLVVLLLNTAPRPLQQKQPYNTLFLWWELVNVNVKNVEMVISV